MNQDTYPVNVLDIQKLNSVVRHRLRNLYAGFDMALDSMESDLQAAGAPSAEKCDLLRADLQDLYRFTERMTLLLDPLPDPEPLELQAVLSEIIEQVSRQHPFCDFQCDGSDEPLTLAHGNWYRIALTELLSNAAEATGQEGTVKMAWKTESDRKSVV